MFSFRKVKPKGNGSENKNQEDQKNYEKKVEALQNACDNFGEYLEKEVNEGTKFVDIAKAFADKDTGFGNQMKKSKLLSRTSRRLQEMKKNLSKFKNETFDPQNIDDFVKCFEFKREKPKKGYIKRSAIDDEKVANFFNENSKGSIREILSVKQKKAKEESIELDKDAGNIFDRAIRSVEAFEQIITKAKDVQKEIAQTISDIKNDEEIEEENINTLNKQDEELKECISALQEMITDLKNEQNQTKKVMSNKNSTNKGKRISLIGLKEKIGANDAATSQLNGKINEAKGTHAEVKKDIEEAKVNPFNRRTGTFTIRTEDGFKKIKNFKDKIKNVVVEKGITTIKDKAFDGFTALASVKLENVQTIGKEAFYIRRSLTSIDLGNVTTIGEQAFKYCTALASIDFKNVQTIENEAFYNCAALESIDLKNVQTIGDKAFWLCDSLASVELGNVKTIGKRAFIYCPALTSIDFKNVQTIDEYAFSECPALTSIDLGNVQTIEKSAFSNCKALGKLGIDFKNVQTIGEWAFCGCNSLASINLGNVTTIKNNAFVACTSLASINLGNVQTIGDKAFKSCTGIKKVILPQNGEKAKEIRDIICSQTGKTAGDGNNNTIEFVNDPEPAAATQEK